MKDKKDFRVLIVYPNLPLMLVPGIAIGILTRLFKDQGYVLDFFETTHYDTEETNLSEVKINYSENRVKLLNARKFSITDDLGIRIKSNMLDDFQKKVIDFQPDFMAFSVVEDTFHQAISMLSIIADLNIKHLIGGVFPTMAPDVCISHKQIQMIGLGEGEDSIIKVSEAVRKNMSLEGIPGTWFKKENGEIIKTEQPPLTNINNVIPDFSLFDESRFMRPMGGRIFKMMPVESYRGCPYACTYCNSPAQRAFTKKNELGTFLRRKTIQNLRDELAHYVNSHDPEFILFVDDSFLARPIQETLEFCDMYEEFKIPFWINTRSENCKSEILPRLKDVNCYRMAFGIESGNEQYRRKILRRNVSNADLIRNFKLIADSGISFSINLIIGMPGETRELVMDTVELARSLKGFDTITSFIFTPYHGTVLREVSVQNGWLDPNIITMHNTSRSLLKMPSPYLNADEIDGLLSVLPLYVYFPKNEWKNIRRAEKNDDEGIRLREYYSEIYAKNFLKEYQDSEKIFLPDVPGDLRDYSISPDRIIPEQLEQLIGPAAGI